ncbi:unnamed protein product [Rhizoctonia solani]|uniref:Ricin B lectin domain-containing protein n=1 Tax=Rhizoctonia solani TaxID=456999 RepID=A0A8H3C2P0_9AGAM|nr:unnamed protein product [Rhizoctonia solani]
MVDLHFGRSTNGNEIHIWPSDGSAKQTWDLVHIDDDTGESHQGTCAQLAQKLDESTKLLSQKEQMIVNKAGRIKELEEGLSRVKDEATRKDHQIAQNEDTIRQLREDLEAREARYSISM